MGHLRVLGALIGGQHGHAHRGDELVLAQHRCEGIFDQVRDRYGAAAGRSLGRHSGAQSGQHRRPIGGRVGMGQVAADGAPVAHGRITDAAGRLGQEAVGPLHVGRRGDLGVGSQRADVDGVAADGDAFDVGDTTDVDHHFRPGQSKAHQRDETVASGQDFRSRVVGKQLYRFRDGTGLPVFKICCKHCNQSSCAGAG